MKRSDRHLKKNKRKKTGWTIAGSLLLFMLLLLAGGVIYWNVQFNKGASLAESGKMDSLPAKPIEFKPFEGAEPAFGKINILLIGNDARSDEERARSDSLLIGQYDSETKTVKLVSLMRDIYIAIPGHGKQKLNAAYAFGGPELVRQTIKENFDIDVNYYAAVNFEGFPKIIDTLAPDGIEVDIPYPMSHGIYMTLEPGIQKLNGEQTLGYVRFRHDRKSDFGRVERQQEILGKLKEQAVSMHTIANLPKLLGLLDPYVDTNVDKRTILKVGGSLLTAKDNPIETLRIPVENSFTDEYYSHAGAVLSIDSEKNKEALQQFLGSTDRSSTTE